MAPLDSFINCNIYAMASLSFAFNNENIALENVIANFTRFTLIYKQHLRKHHFFKIGVCSK